jgi:predicted DCC family thiol-disulfide oxidoreductase YuxK
MTKNIILYDGKCGLCNRSVQFILKFERNQKLQFTSLQSAFSKKVLSDFNMKNDFEESILFFDDGKLFSKSRAVLKIIPFLKWYFYPFLILWVLPGFVRDFIYDQIAKNRKRFANDCILKETENATRFLD